MKKTFKSTVTVILALIFIFSLASCNDAKKTDVWENAVYLEDTELGEGAKTLTIEVKAEDKTVTFTVHTDKDTVGEALIENELISGEEGPYGIYIKSVNGMVADYDIDKSYWSFYIDGEYALNGVDQTDISEGAVYRLEYTKE